MDTIEMQMTDNGDLATNSLYELNKQAYNTVMPLNDVDIKQNLEYIYEWIKEQSCKYTMLLCHERRDYTILHYTNTMDKKYYNGTLTDLRECLENRGKILDIRYVQNQDAWEIWLRINEDGELINYMYMFFNGEGFVVEV